MTRLLTWLAIGTLAGCAATEPVELPDWDIPEATAEVTQPLELPELPELRIDADRAVLNRDGVLALIAYRETAEANYTIAQANAQALEQQVAAYNALIRAGQLMVEIARIREDMLAQERAQAFQDRMFYRGLLALGIAAAL